MMNRETRDLTGAIAAPPDKVGQRRWNLLLFVFCLVFLTLLRFWLLRNEDIVGFPSGYDDHLYVDLGGACVLVATAGRRLHAPASGISAVDLVLSSNRPAPLFNNDRARDLGVALSRLRPAADSCSAFGLRGRLRGATL